VDTCTADADVLWGDVIIQARDMATGAVFELDFLISSTVTRTDPVPGSDPNDPLHLSRIDATISHGVGILCDPAFPLDFTQPLHGCVAWDHPVLGTTTIQGGGPGTIIEKTGPGTPDCNFPADPTLACSFFDISHTIFTETFGPLRPLDPQTLDPLTIRMFTQIDRIPPSVGTEYIGQGLPVVLFDDNDIPRAEILSVIHEIKPPPIPEPATALLFACGLATLVLVRRTRSKVGIS
jgi:hypothetical protein